MPPTVIYKILRCAVFVRVTTGAGSVFDVWPLGGRGLDGRHARQPVYRIPHATQPPILSIIPGDDISTRTAREGRGTTRQPRFTWVLRAAPASTTLPRAAATHAQTAKPPHSIIAFSSAAWRIRVTHTIFALCRAFAALTRRTRHASLSHGNAVPGCSAYAGAALLAIPSAFMQRATRARFYSGSVPTCTGLCLRKAFLLAAAPRPYTILRLSPFIFCAPRCLPRAFTVTTVTLYWRTTNCLPSNLAILVFHRLLFL